MGNCFVPCRIRTAPIVVDDVAPKHTKVLKADVKVLEFQAPGNVKDVIPLLDSVTEMNSCFSPPTTRIKIIITKQQLQELLKHQESVQKVFSLGWKPKLQSIPEGSEHVTNVATD